MTTLMNGLILLQAEPKPQGSFAWTLMLMVGLFLIMYFMLLRPQIKQQKEQKRMLESLKAGDKIITTGGIWGEIESVEKDRVRLKIADKTKVVLSRSAVGGFQSKATEPSGKDEKNKG